MNRINEPDELQLKFSKRCPRLMLASSSANRKGLLEAGGSAVEIFIPDADETKKGSTFISIVENIAAKKLDAYLSSSAFRPDIPAIAADTLVLFSNSLLGKPADYQDAKRMLKMLSGNKHSVISAVGLFLPGGGKKVFSDVAEVYFKSLDENEIDAYLETGEWCGAAGAYRLQKTGYKLVEHISGDWTTVVGLPLERILKESQAISE